MRKTAMGGKFEKFNGSYKIEVSNDKDYKITLDVDGKVVSVDLQKSEDNRLYW